MVKNREIWADIIRIIATFFIILVHTSGIYKTSMLNYYSSLTYSTFGYLGVPLFLIISGYFLLNKKEDAKTFFKKRINRIILPWISWSLILTLIQALEIKNYSLIFLLKTFKESFQAFWFLPLLTCLYLLTPFLRNLLNNSSKKEVFLMLIFWFLAFSLFPYLINSQAFPYSVDNGLVRQTFGFIGFYIFGFYLFTLSKEQINKYYYYFVIIVFTILIVSTIILVNLPEIKNLNIQLIHYFSPTIVFASICLTIFLNMLLKKMKLSKNSQKLITEISGLSLGIYFLHDVILSKLIKGYIFVDPNNFYSGLINAILILIVSIIILLIIGRIPIIKRLLI